MLNVKTIVIAEDEPKTRKGISGTLEQWFGDRVRIHAFADGLDALSFLQVHPVHLLITDIRMPGMTGLSLIDSVRQRRPDMSAIIISGYAEFEYAREALELKVCSYLLKPLLKDKLIEAAEKALKDEENRNRLHMLEQIADEEIARLGGSRLSLSAPLNAIFRFIEENYDRPIGLKEAAAAVHMNPSYVSAMFKEQTGLTFSEYLTRYRIQKAKEYLLATGLSVNEISEKVGYLTAKYFIKVFREQERISPGEFRKRWRAL